eukprot:scaffold285_cov330-Pavlova_lutheri.AAC.9
METGGGMGSKGVPTGFDEPSCILGAIPQGLKRDMAAPMRVRTPAMRTACWGGGHRRRVGLCRRRNSHWEARAEPSSSGSDAEWTPAPRNEETEDSLGERAEKTVLVQYKTRAEQFRSDAKEVLETLSQNVAKMALVRYVVAVWRAARRRYEEYDERFRKWQFLKTQHRWEFEQGSEPEKQLVLEMLRFMAEYFLGDRFPVRLVLGGSPEVAPATADRMLHFHAAPEAPSFSSHPSALNPRRQTCCVGCRSWGLRRRTEPAIMHPLSVLLCTFSGAWVRFSFLGSPVFLRTFPFLWFDVQARLQPSHNFSRQGVVSFLFPTLEGRERGTRLPSLGSHRLDPGCPRSPPFGYQSRCSVE